MALKPHHRNFKSIETFLYVLESEIPIFIRDRILVGASENYAHIGCWFIISGRYIPRDRSNGCPGSLFMEELPPFQFEQIL
jgi:hypothetical protein